MQSSRSASSKPLNAKSSTRCGAPKVCSGLGLAASLLVATPAVGGPTEEPARSPRSEQLAGGQPYPKTLLVVRGADDAEFAERIRTELQATGWRILETDGTEERATPEDLAQLAAELGASATVRVHGKSGKVDIFILRSSGNIVETLQSDPGPFDARVLALRTTEALRARGLELGEGRSRAATSTRAAEATPEPDRRQRATRRQRDAAPEKMQAGFGATNAPGRLALVAEAAPTMIVSPGGLGVASAAWLDLRLELSSTFSLCAVGALPLSSHRVRGVQGEADVSTRLLGVAAEVNGLRRSLVTAAAGVGAAAFVTSMRGTAARQGFAVANEWVTTGGPFSYVRVGVGNFGDKVQLFALALGGLSVPEVRVAFGDAQVGRWGQPFGLFALGIDWRFIRW